MKPVPRQRLTLEFLDGLPYGVVDLPTPEATKNFESYLDEVELKFYKALPPAVLLHLHLCSDPFVAFANMYAKEARSSTE